MRGLIKSTAPKYQDRTTARAWVEHTWMATLLGTIPEAAVLIDGDRRIQFLNRRAEEVTGWAGTDILGRDLEAVLPLVESASGLRWNQILSPASEPGVRVQMPRGLMAGRRCGRWFPIEGAVTPSVDRGKVTGALITFRDAATGQGNDEAATSYPAGTSGFNKLFFVMLGLADEKNATGIAPQLLKLSRKELTRNQNVNLNEAIGEMEEVLRSGNVADFKCELRLDPGLRTVRANHEQLKQVVLNLVMNARNAMPGGGIVRIETENTGEAFIALRVTDTGTGVNAETLGLAVVRRVIAEIGGAIHVKRQPGEGTAFTIHIPWASAPLPERKPFRATRKTANKTATA